MYARYTADEFWDAGPVLVIFGDNGLFLSLIESLSYGGNHRFTERRWPWEELAQYDSR